jgi:hypothetical protein
MLRFINLCTSVGMKGRRLNTLLDIEVLPALNDATLNEVRCSKWRGRRGRGNRLACAEQDCTSR